MIKLNEKLKQSTENKGLSIFPNYFFGVVLTSKLKKPLGIVYPAMFCEYYGDSNRWANDIGAANKNAKIILDMLIKDGGFAERIIGIYDKYERGIKNLDGWILETDLKGLEQKEITEKFKLFVDLYVNVITYSWLPIASEGFESRFTNLLKGFIRKKLEDSKKINDYFVILSTPEDETMRQKSERELALFLKKSRNKKWIKEVNIGKKNLEDFDENIQNFVNKFLEKYNWITFDYEGPALNWKDVIERLREISKSETKSADTKKRKSYEEELDLKNNRLYYRLFKTIRKFMFVKNRSQETLFYSNYCLEKLLLEVASRTGFGLEEVRSMTAEEIVHALRGDVIDKKTLRNRRKHCIFVFDGGEYQIIAGEKGVKSFLGKNLERERIEKTKKIVGETACSGIAMGKVKIIQSAKEMGKMCDGDVLVSSKTSPSLMPVIRKAAAIVTDYGGVTCHAAIVSRELNIPCVIGTRNATKILKDGDLVVVDAKKGVIDVIKRR